MERTAAAHFFSGLSSGAIFNHGFWSILVDLAWKSTCVVSQTEIGSQSSWWWVHTRKNVILKKMLDSFETAEAAAAVLCI